MWHINKFIKISYVNSQKFHAIIIVDCEWDEWNIGECDKSCGGGIRTNTRVLKVNEQHGGVKCSGASNVSESCNIQECPSTLIISL